MIRTRCTGCDNLTWDPTTLTCTIDHHCPICHTVFTPTSDEQTCSWACTRADQDMVEADTRRM